MSVKSVIDRKALYIPDPGRWNWETLSEAEIANRLNGAFRAVELLDHWTADLETTREAGRKALWAALPDAKLYEVQVRRAELEEMGKELKQLARLKKQVLTAIATIQEHEGAVA